MCWGLWLAGTACKWFVSCVPSRRKSTRLYSLSPHMRERPRMVPPDRSPASQARPFVPEACLAGARIRGSRGLRRLLRRCFQHPRDARPGHGHLHALVVVNANHQLVSGGIHRDHRAEDAAGRHDLVVFLQGIDHRPPLLLLLLLGKPDHEVEQEGNGQQDQESVPVVPRVLGEQQSKLVKRSGHDRRSVWCSVGSAIPGTKLTRDISRPEAWLPAIRNCTLTPRVPKLQAFPDVTGQTGPRRSPDESRELADGGTSGYGSTPGSAPASPWPEKGGAGRSD